MSDLSENTLKFLTDYSYKVGDTGYTLFYKIKPSSQYNPEPLVSITGLIFVSSVFNNDKTLTIPEKINEYRVENIAASAFEDNKDIKEVFIPNTVKHIGQQAFKSSSVEFVHIGTGVKKIHDFAFEGCENLTNIVLSEGLEVLGDAVFIYCDKLTSISFPDTLKEIGSAVFDECKSLDLIHMGAGLSKIGNVNTGDFAYSCPMLRNITISPFNNHYKVDRDILYNIDDNTLLRVFNGFRPRDVIIPKWVTDVSLGSFDSVFIKKLVIKPNYLQHIDAAGIGFVDKVYCVPNSGIDDYFEERGVKTIPIFEGKINKFLNDLTIEDENINK